MGTVTIKVGEDVKEEADTMTPVMPILKEAVEKLLGEDMQLMTPRTGLELPGLACVLSHKYSNAVYLHLKSSGLTQPVCTLSKQMIDEGFHSKAARLRIQEGASMWGREQRRYKWPEEDGELNEKACQFILGWMRGAAYRLAVKIRDGKRVEANEKPFAEWQPGPKQGQRLTVEEALVEPYGKLPEQDRWNANGPVQAAEKGAASFVYDRYESNSLRLLVTLQEDGSICVRLMEQHIITKAWSFADKERRLDGSGAETLNRLPEVAEALQHMREVQRGLTYAENAVEKLCKGAA